jgi:hypothetical protein
MSTLPNVIINQTNGNLGRVGTSQDGTSLLIGSGIAVGGKFALGDVLGPFTSLSEVETAGITEAYDTTNEVLMHQHAKDFYLGAGDGVALYIMVVANTVTMTQMVDKTLTHVAKALSQAQGAIKLVAVSRIPDTIGTIADQFEADIVTAITKAQELVASEFAEPNHRPISVLIEGRNFGGTAASAKDFRTMAANRVSVVVSQDADVAAKDAAFAKYANVGYALGVLAGLPVQRNIGRVKNGALTIGTPALSSGALLTAVSATDQESLNAKGMIFIKKHVGKDGFFFNDDHTCVPLTDDYAFITSGRVMDKVSRIARTIYVEDLLDEIEIDATTGRLPVSTCKAFQSSVEASVNGQMTANGELAGIEAYVNPAQNVQTTDKLSINISVVKKGTARTIEAELGYAISINN